jgi:hypothetical protein
MIKIMQHRFLALLAILMISLVSLASQPQGRKHHGGFDPKRFQAELEQFITTNACLTPSEAAKFFPVYRQMGKKMRMIFDEMRRTRHVNPNDNEACAESIRRQDELDIQLKQLQQEYHSRFMTILSPKKVFSVIKAEERFHRQAFKRMKK